MTEAEIDLIEKAGREHLRRALAALEAAIIANDAAAKRKATEAQHLAQTLINLSRSARRGWGMV